ncbi:MAG: hypothetical protein K1X55_05260 [Chitinophagales bacterium]|nr:hypothetical protein [Chitinophagales bacterium]
MSTFSFEAKTKKNLAITIVVGLILFGLGLIFQGSKHDTHHENEHGETMKTEEVSKHATTTVASTHSESVTDSAVHTDTSHAVALAAASVNTYEYKDVSAEIDEELQSLGDRSHYAHHKVGTLKDKIITNLYAVVLFFLYIGLAAMFVLAATTLALGGWQIQMQKIFLAIASTIPVSIIIMVVLFATNMHTIFEWSHAELYDPASPHYDALLFSKHDYLNVKGFWIRSIIFFSISLGLLYFWWKNLNSMDVNPSIRLYNTSRGIAGATILLVAMGVNPFGTWDWAMSIQPHWYSTLYAWYLMASGAVSMFSLTMLLIIFLKKKGNLPGVNENHRHDIGKFMFAISVFWTYLFFSQFMLQWYANIPEETIYFDKREAGYFILFWGSFVLCFLVPFFTLMKRASKRSIVATSVMAFVIILAHYFDFFLVVVPEVVPEGGFGFLGLGFLVALAGVYMFWIFNSLTKFKDLESSTHPLYRESIKHQI